MPAHPVLHVLNILVVADDPLARAGLAALLGAVEGVALAGQGDGRSAAVDDGEMDVVVWDLGAAAGGLERLRAWVPEGAPVLAIVASAEEAAEALAAGARGALFRDAGAERLAAGARAVAGGLVVLDDDMAGDLLRPPVPGSPEPPEPLTPREREVLQLLAQGLANRAIGDRLGISERTAKFHVNAILAKLGAQSRTEALVQAVRLGLVTL